MGTKGKTMFNDEADYKPVSEPGGQSVKKISRYRGQSIFAVWNVPDDVISCSDKLSELLKQKQAQGLFKCEL